MAQSNVSSGQYTGNQGGLTAGSSSVASTPPQQSSPEMQAAQARVSQPNYQALHTESGWQSARNEVASSAALDQRAVDDYHATLNMPQAGGGSTPYISRDTAQWDMERRGMLPSQREENERRINDYVQTNGVSRNEAINSLNESRGLTQHDHPTPPRPEQFASYADEQYFKQDYAAQVAQAKATGQPAPSMQECKATLEAQGKLPSQQTSKP